MSLASVSFPALGTTASVGVVDSSALAAGRAVLEQELFEVDLACSRFRDDSELALLNAAGGGSVVVGPRLFEAIAAALRAATISDGLVDPTIGETLRLAGYDRTFALVRDRDGASFRARFASVPGWRRIEIDAARHAVRVPRGVELDLGATAKALAADRAAQAVARATGCGALVGLGGDIAVAGEPPAGGWPLRVSDDHAAPLDAAGPAVSIRCGGLATSSTTVRRWRAADVDLHHIVDPRTGRSAETPWRTVTVAAASCLDANVAEHRGDRPRRRGAGVALRTRAAGATRRRLRVGRARRRLARRGLTMLAAVVNAKALWYLTRGTGTVALLLLTVSIVLGVTTSTRWKSSRWPRFLVNGLHKNVTLLALALVVVHVATTIADRFAPIGLLDAVVPLHSAYRPVWLGLGALAFDLLLALIATSLLRARIGFKTWRAVHWLAYASWPVALMHALGTGSDARSSWFQLIGVVCAGSVVAAVLWRVATARGGTVVVRGAAVFAAFAVPIAVLVWARGGPLHRGWAARAGTPTRLLASARVPAVKSTSASTVAASLPRRFDATLVGHVTQSQENNGYVVVKIDATTHRGFAGRVHIAIRGVPLDQGGVQMVDSVVGLLPSGGTAWAAGHITALAGTNLAATVRDSNGRPLHVRFALTLDPTSDGVSGTLHAGGSPSDGELPA